MPTKDTEELSLAAKSLFTRTGIKNQIARILEIAECAGKTVEVSAAKTMLACVRTAIEVLEQDEASQSIEDLLDELREAKAAISANTSSASTSFDNTLALPDGGSAEPH